MARYRFWIHDKDEEGRALDEEIVKAAEEIAPIVTRYRQKEIRCESTANRLLQDAVEAASKARHSRPIENPTGYLTYAYKRIVDKFLNRQKRVVAVDELFLEDLANSSESVSYEGLIHDRLLLERLMQAMDPDTRRVCSARLDGYSMVEIARQLHVTPNCLAVRYMRGLKKAAKRVLGEDEQR